MSSRVQLAAAVAYSAVFYRGSVQIKSADGCLQLGTEDSAIFLNHLSRYRRCLALPRVLQPGAGRSASDEVEFDATWQPPGVYPSRVEVVGSGLGPEG